MSVCVELTKLLRKENFDTNPDPDAGIQIQNGFRYVICEIIFCLTISPIETSDKRTCDT